MSLKLIVSNKSALSKKYGSGLTAITRAVRELIAADAARGLTTRLVYLDDEKAMKSVGAKAVKSPKDEPGAKNAIDKLYAKRHPDYITILGAIDVVPHQTLTNPVGNDGDVIAPGDLPYACDAPYGRLARSFLAPTRVVSRLPDIVGADNPKYLVALLRRAATWKSLTKADYEKYFGLTASVWKQSTSMSLAATFGAADSMLQSPSSDDYYQWTSKQLQALSHFINCHGTQNDPKFYGQVGKKYPVSHLSSWIKKKVRPGTIATAECCYGAELYDPELAEGVVGMANAYLGEGAYAYVGSSTIAYGPADENSSADLLTQYFMQAVLGGASTGRAMLMARQKFVSWSGPVLDPMDLKTLAQFSLMGDPSIHPVAGKKVKAAKEVKGLDLAQVSDHARSQRRAEMVAYGKALPSRVGYAGVETSSRGNVTKILRRLARRAGLKNVEYTARKVTGSAEFRASSKAFGGASDVVHVALERPRKKTLPPGTHTRAIVVQAVGTRVVKVRTYYAK